MLLPLQGHPQPSAGLPSQWLLPGHVALLLLPLWVCLALRQVLPLGRSCSSPIALQWRPLLPVAWLLLLLLLYSMRRLALGGAAQPAWGQPPARSLTPRVQLLWRGPETCLARRVPVWVALALLPALASLLGLS